MKKSLVYFLLFTFAFFPKGIFELIAFPVHASDLVPATQYFIFKKAQDLQSKVGNRQPTDQEIEDALNKPESSMQPKAYRQDDRYFLTTGIDGSVALLQADSGTYKLDVKPVREYELTGPQKIVVLADKTNIVTRIGVKVSLKDDVPPAAPKREDSIPAGSLAVQFYADANGDGIQQQFEPNLPWAGIRVNLQKETGSYRYNLVEGWNLVAFPFEKEEFETAAALLMAINLQGGEVTTVARWENGDYEEYVRRLDHAVDNVYGKDFVIEPGRGYFIRNHRKTTVEIFGKRVTQPFVLSLKKGYNLVGLNPWIQMTALGVINASPVLPGGENAVKTVTQFQSGLLDPLVKDKGEVYGFDFGVQAFKGYFINVREASTLKM